jgi:acyl dehydratase
MNLAKVIQHRLPALDHAYTQRDVMLYALGLGYGRDPLNEAELRFVYENELLVVPSLCVVLAHPGFWLRQPEFGVVWVRALHAEQSFEIHKPLPPGGTVRGTFRVLAVDDKGPEKGTLIHQEKVLADPHTGERFATVRWTLFLRGDGGSGDFGEAPLSPAPLPERAPDRTLEVPTEPGQALLYRLSGDWNPLHADPSTARRAGFNRPILHGLCTNGIACRAIVEAYCRDEPQRLQSMYVRFSKPVYPGETLRIEIFEDPDALRFRVVALERGEIVLDRGSATIRGTASQR